MKVPRMRGQAQPYRAQVGQNGGNTSEVRKQLSVEREGGGRSQRDIEEGLEQAGGQVGLSNRTVSDLAEN